MKDKYVERYKNKTFRKRIIAVAKNVKAKGNKQEKKQEEKPISKSNFSFRLQSVDLLVLGRGSMHLS